MLVYATPRSHARTERVALSPEITLGSEIPCRKITAIRPASSLISDLQSFNANYRLDCGDILTILLRPPSLAILFLVKQLGKLLLHHLERSSADILGAIIMS
jgi:hypothetical protein